MLVWALWLSCETSHTTTRELQTRTCERPGASNTTKIPREDPQRGKKRTNFAAGEGKKARNFGPPTLRAPNLRPPLFLGLGPHPFGAQPLRAPWVWPLVCIKKNKQLKITKKQLKKSKQFKITRKQFQKIQTINTKNPNN